MRASGLPAIVRVPGNEAWWIGRVLDAGSQGVIVPMVNDRSEAEAAASACRYPPLGTRSYGPLRSGMYIGPDPDVANRVVACTVQIETVRAVENVEGFRRCARRRRALPWAVGPRDRHGAEAGRARRPGFERALERVRRVGAEAGVRWGCSAYPERPPAAGSMKGSPSWSRQATSWPWSTVPFENSRPPKVTVSVRSRCRRLPAEVPRRSSAGLGIHRCPVRQ